jgi:cob(I)alamin adenosyltransferase
MVRLTKIYTRTGDNGTTGLGSGVRVDKDNIRVEAYGEVDEANAALGLAALECGRAKTLKKIGKVLERIQQDMFDVGADLCVPIEKAEKPGSKLRILPEQTKRIESIIDQYNTKLPALSSFVLPGGSPAATALHLARTAVRRAERRIVTLTKAEPMQTNMETVRYLNRVSDLLFVLSRVANGGGKGDVLWVPGANRSK